MASLNQNGEDFEFTRELVQALMHEKFGDKVWLLRMLQQLEEEKLVAEQRVIYVVYNNYKLILSEGVTLSARFRIGGWN